MANIFNISPRYPFLDVLASYILKTAKDKNLNIADDIILLPTRRACRHIKEAILRSLIRSAAMHHFSNNWRGGRCSFGRRSIAA